MAIASNNSGFIIDKGNVVRISEQKTKNGDRVANATVVRQVWDKEAKKELDDFIDIAFFDGTTQDGKEIKNASFVLDSGIKEGDPIFFSAKLADKQGEGNRKYMGYSSMCTTRYTKDGETSRFAPRGYIVIDGKDADNKKSVVALKITGIFTEGYVYDENGQQVKDEAGNPVKGPLKTKSGKPKITISGIAGKEKYLNVDIINTQHSADNVENAKKVLKVGDIVFFNASNPRVSQDGKKTSFTAFSFTKYGEMKEKDGKKFPFFYGNKKDDNKKESSDGGANTAAAPAATDDEEFIDVSEYDTADIPFFNDGASTPASGDGNEDFLDC